MSARLHELATDLGTNSHNLANFFQGRQPPNTNRNLNEVTSITLLNSYIHWCRLFSYERFCACFVFKFALQMGEGERREGVQISK